MGTDKFDEAVEVHFKLGLDVRKADQMLRSTTTLPHGIGKAKRVIFLCMQGGPAHMDTFDYKPKLREDDGKTGVLALGSFSAASFTALGDSLLTGLQNLKEQGATQLIVDVVRAIPGGPVS